MLLTIITSIILVLSFKERYGVSFSYYSIILLLIRQNVRLLDFEQTRANMTPLEWSSYLVTFVAMNASFIPIISIMFGNLRWNKLSMCLIFYFSAVCTYVGLHDPTEFVLPIEFVKENVSFYIIMILFSG